MEYGRVESCLLGERSSRESHTPVCVMSSQTILTPGFLVALGAVAGDPAGSKQDAPHSVSGQAITVTQVPRGQRHTCFGDEELTGCAQAPHWPLAWRAGREPGARSTLEQADSVQRKCQTWAAGWALQPSLGPPACPLRAPASCSEPGSSKMPSKCPGGSPVRPPRGRLCAQNCGSLTRGALHM